ncbi:hypothetical protein N8Z37_01310 [Octadecabacter sp.]|nr:hypothetical protein [Octadecabacter sp.]
MKLILGDNQFFGVNHSNLAKAEAYRHQFSEPAVVESFIKGARELGVDEIFVSTHPSADDLVSFCNASNVKIHPAIPYAHAMNDLAAAQGVVRLIVQRFRPSHTDLFKLILSYLLGNGLFTPKSTVRRFVNSELNLLGKIDNKGTLFLNNVFTDLIIGAGCIEFFQYFTSVAKELGYKPGFVTYNYNFFQNNKFHDCALCVNYNLRGFLSPSFDEVQELKKCYEVSVMGVMGSGIYDFDEVLRDLNRLDPFGVVYGTSRLERLKKMKEELK